MQMDDDDDNEDLDDFFKSPRTPLPEDAIMRVWHAENFEVEEGRVNTRVTSFKVRNYYRLQWDFMAIIEFLPYFTFGIVYDSFASV